MLGVQGRRETQGVGSWGRSLTAQHVILEVGWVMELTICLNTLPSFSQQDIFKKGIWPTILIKTFRDADETEKAVTKGKESQENNIVVKLLPRSKIFSRSSFKNILNTL